MSSTPAATQGPAAAPLPEPILWDAQLSVGIEEIDGQHRVLIDVANSLRDSVAAQRSRREVLALLEQLVDYTRIHFAIEEALMRVHAFPDYPTHRRGHDSLMGQIYALRHRALDRPCFDATLVSDVQRWVVGHIREADPDYHSHFAARGVELRYADPEWNSDLWGG